MFCNGIEFPVRWIGTVIVNYAVKLNGATREQQSIEQLETLLSV